MPSFSSCIFITIHQSVSQILYKTFDYFVNSLHVNIRVQCKQAPFVISIDHCGR